MGLLNKLHKLYKASEDFGFKWTDENQIFKQVISEIDEIKDAIIKCESSERISEEIGDLIQASLELCFYFKLNPNDVLNKTAKKFGTRLKFLKEISKEHNYESLNNVAMTTQLSLWAKAKERSYKSFDNEIIYKPLAISDISMIVDAFAKLGWNKSASLFEQYFNEQEIGKREIWIAWQGKEFTGYVTLVMQSEYKYFKENNIPEIKDLNVLPKFRKHGIGDKLLELAEDKTCKKFNKIGIGVGLYADYSDAHRLYLNRGYELDNNGISSNDGTLKYGEQTTLDDDLVLYMIKDLY